MTDIRHDAAPAPAEGPNRSIAQVRRHFHELLGRDCLRRLHAERRWVDRLALIALPSIFAALAWALARLPFGAAWAIAFVLQGFVLMACGLACHEWLHRGFPSGRGGVLARFLLMMPLYRSATHYMHWHTIHHVHLGHAGDSEQFKRYIDTPRRRVLYATFLGVVFPRLALTRRRMTRRAPAARTAPCDAANAAAIGREKRGLVVFTATWMLLALAFPREVLLGYALPLVVVTPLASTVRTVIEHSVFDDGNPFQLGCFYRTTPFTRLLFFWNSGDCHFVHHIFPRLPFYSVPRALALMRAEFLRMGVVEERSLGRLVVDWFAATHPYLGRGRTPRA